MTTRAFPQLTAFRGGKRRRLRNLLLGISLIVLSGIGFFGYHMYRAPAERDARRTQTSQQSHFVVTYEPSGTVPVNTFQSWTLKVTTSTGQPVEGARLTVTGDMPQHGHGLASQPQVTQDLGGGRYLLEGLKFQMNGWWVITVMVRSGNVTDTVSFNLNIQ